jgi:hypothetical protein
MQSRSVSLGEMFAWVPATFDWFSHGVGALVGASAILLLAGFAMSIPLYAIMFATTGWHTPVGSPFAGQSTLFWVVYAADVGAKVVLYPPLLVGWFRLARDVDTGAGASATGILQPYRDPALWLRTLALALLALLVAMVVVALFVAAFYKPIIAFMTQLELQQAATAAGQSPPSSDFPWVLVPAYFLFICTMAVLQFAFLVACAEVALRPTPAATALRAAFGGVLRNLHKLLVLMLVLGIATMVVMLVAMLVFGLALAAMSMISPRFAVVGMFALMLPVMLTMYPLVFGGHYFMWKDMLGGAAPDPGGVEA